MLFSLILLAHLISSHPAYSATVMPAQVHVTAESHKAHMRHLAHMHYLHEQHLAMLERRRSDPPQHAATVTVHVSTALSSHLGCGGLEALWVAAGGAYWAKVTAASVAMAESGGNEYATGPAGERGYWQIHPDHGSLSTYDPFGNARAAVLISHDGSDWSAWTTFTSGAYVGRCLQLSRTAAGRAGLAVL
jgi:hypothetical protein